MRSRFPHGGEVLGAAPANPILAPVLSQDRALSMSRQRDLLDLQAIQRIPGLVGYWKADPQYLFEDSAGTIPASTSGTGPVGQWRSVGNAPSLGPILNSNSDCASALPFAKTDENGSVSTLSLNTTNPISGTQDARLVITTSYEGRPYLVPTGFAPTNNVVGATYRLQFDYKVNSGTFRILALYSGGSLVTLNTSLTGSGTFSYDLTCAGTSSYIGTIYCGNYTCDVQLDNVKIQQLTGITAYQPTTANKPILRKTPTTGVYWADANTSTSALNVALGNLGSACTVARSSAEGVTFTEGVTISSTYNLAPAYSFNSDVAIFNRALTDVEKALITRYMQRAVPLLGSNLVTNGTFDTDLTGWSKYGPDIMEWADTGKLRIIRTTASTHGYQGITLANGDMVLFKASGAVAALSPTPYIILGTTFSSGSVVSFSVYPAKTVNIAHMATGTRYIQLACYNGSGTVEFDDVSMRKIL